MSTKRPDARRGDAEFVFLSALILFVAVIADFAQSIGDALDHG